jgi:undecaprenol kinase
MDYNHIESGSQMKKHHISFKHAWDGVVLAFKTQPNFKIHLTLSAISILLGVYLHISGPEWAVILFVIATGLAFELVNTAIEFTVDLLTQEYQLLAKFAKDTSAAAMLVYACFSIIIAAVIFIPKII